MTTALHGSTAVLVVTGPARERLCQHFRRLYAGRDDVRVVAERRVRERRGSPVHVAIERRSGERRRSAPWFVFPPH